MTLHFAKGSPSTVLGDEELRQALVEVYQGIGGVDRVLIVPPDYTRLNSRAGQLTCMSCEHFGEAVVDVLPAFWPGHGGRALISEHA